MREQSLWTCYKMSLQILQMASGIRCILVEIQDRWTTEEVFLLGDVCNLRKMYRYAAQPYNLLLEYIYVYIFPINGHNVLNNVLPGHSAKEKSFKHSLQQRHQHM